MRAPFAAALGGTGRLDTVEGMNRFFTADLHFGHAKIIDYCQRPFSDVDEMDDWLVAAWNDTVAVDDEVWVVGDVCLGSLDRTLARVSELHGTKHLVAGNHDRVFRHAGRARPAWERRYREAGFVEIVHGTAVVDAGAPVRVCHFPYGDTSPNPGRYGAARPIDDGTALVHGHTHGRWRMRDLELDVGVDAWAGRPVAAETVLTLLGAGPAELGPLAWRT